MRGRRADFFYHPEEGRFSKGGVGNFIELLNFRVCTGDINLGERMRKSARNALYISKTTQNDLITCWGSVISDQIICELKEAKFFSIVAYEAADSSHKEQLSLVLRFVDSGMNIREDFIQFVHFNGFSGEELAATIMRTLNNHSLELPNCIGQAYDGAWAVPSVKNGCSSVILRSNKYPLYTHCYSHRMNLAISKRFTFQCIRNVLEHIKEISYFFNISEPGHQQLKRNIKELCPESDKRCL